MLRRLWRFAAPMAAIVLLGMVSAARANTVTISYLGLTPDGLGNFDHHYRADVTPPGISAMLVGDFFTIYDIGGYVSNTAIAGSTSFTQSTGTGVAGDGVIAASLTTPDSAGVTNLTYQATSLIASGTYLFDIKSTLGATVLDSFVGRDHTSGLATTNYGSVSVPVPLPAAVWAGMSLMGLMGFEGVRRKRQQNGAELA